MKRREFLKALCAAGVAVQAAPIWLSEAEAAESVYGGPLLLFIQAYGGWDPIQFCDPKGGLRGFIEDEIEVAGGLRYAPMSWSDASNRSFSYVADLFSALHKRMCVIRGLNMETNVHVAGAANAFQGRFENGFPTLAAALCAARAPNLLMSYMVQGEFQSTGGLIPYSPFSSPTVLQSLLAPSSSTVHRVPDDVLEIIEAEQRVRLERLISDKSIMPRRRKMLQYFSEAANGSAGLERLSAILPSSGFDAVDENGTRSELVRKCDSALHAMASGLTAAADLQFSNGYIDSHANHYIHQGKWLSELAYGLRYLWKRVEEIDARAGSNISDRLTVVIHSEFGRTPHFNADDGTDHWPTTSAIVMRKDFETNGVGSRAVGYSTNDGRYLPGRINPVTLEPDPEGGVELKSAHLHKALRKLLGIANSPILANFGFPDVEDINIFTPGLSTHQP